jgi:hypothetical protein
MESRDSDELEHTALYQSTQRPTSSMAHQVTSSDQRAKMLKALGEDASVLHDEGISAQDAKQAGFEKDELLAAGYSSSELMAAGFTSANLCASLRDEARGSASGSRAPASE